MSQYGDALQYASEALSGDREVVLESVRYDGRELDYASFAFYINYLASAFRCD